MDSVSGSKFAEQANSDRYTGVPYSKLDCQAFVEQVLKDCGVRKPDGSPYNWRGSNAMWRQALSWKGTLEECRQTFGEIPLGAWVFIVKHDGGEVERGYHDNEGNATHVGIYCRTGDEPVRDSTKTSKRDGVGYRSLNGFTHAGLPLMIYYNGSNSDSELKELTAIATIRNPSSTDRDILEALKTLTKYMKGV